MFETPLKIFRQGFTFVKSNPQIIYTLFLVLTIPLAFFFTSEQFLKVARDNQDRLERSRIGLLQDTFALFASERIGDSSYLNVRIKEIGKNNETMTHFQVLGVGDTQFPVIASLDEKDVGTLQTPDPLTSSLLGVSGASPDRSYASEFFQDGTRYWRSVRAIAGTSSKSVVGYVVTDLSMAQADAVSRKNIRNAYIVLAMIIVLIIVLLARQARILDYATLYARLKEVDQMKDDFVSMAAHELRTPLAIIRGYADLLTGEDALSPEGKTNLKNIDQAALSLNALIGDILDVSKLQEGRMSFRYEACDVSPQITAVVDSLMKPAHDKNLTLSYVPAPCPTIMIDVDRFRQIMVNLVGNAIKYTPQGSVTVTTSVSGDHVVIRVSDTGMGISAADQQKLFGKFFRVKNEETQMITGTGLGLWITAQMVKTMKGTLAVESIKGKGSDFIISFPVAPLVS